MKQDLHQRAKEAYEDARDSMLEQHDRMREDLEFSNPAAPKQWSDVDVRDRKGRHTLTFDRTNQFISQVVNDGRMNVPQIKIIPGDKRASDEAAELLNGHIRQIEYASRAAIAYTTGLEHSARVGLGWWRVVPKVVSDERNEQEPRIMRIHDPLSCMLNAGWTEPDGSDATKGFCETLITRAEFKRRWPKAVAADWWDKAGIWTVGDDLVRVCEYFEVHEELENRLLIEHPETRERVALKEDEYWQLAQQIGIQLPVVDRFEAKTYRQTWAKLTGKDVLEETDFPCRWVPLVPVLGYELWIDGQRYLCGITRRQMEPQRFHNLQMSSIAESLATQPKAPYLVPARAIEGLDNHWQALSTGNPAFLPYNDVDLEGNPIAPPSRQAPAVFPAGFANAATMAGQEMEASVGMYKANLGQQGNETSGIAIQRRKVEGDTANYHYLDNRNRSVEHTGRILVDMIRRLSDTPRTVRTMGHDNTPGFARYDPDMDGSARNSGGKVEVVNPTFGEFDVMVKAGPAFTSLREETAAQLGEMFKAAPQLMTVLGPMWARMQDWPEADRVAKLLLAMAPPQVQAIENAEEEVPPAAQARIMGLEQQLQQAQQMMQQLAQKAQDATLEREKVEAEILTDGYRAHTERLKVVPPITPEQVQALVLQTLRQVLGEPNGPSSQMVMPGLPGAPLAGVSA